MNSGNRSLKLKSASWHEQSCMILLPVLALLALAQLVAPLGVDAGTIWTGPPMIFTKLAGTDPTQSTNQDQITPNVWLTRGDVQGLYNIKTEAFFTHFLSPADTEWADGTTANTNLSYTDWNTWAKITHGGPPNTVGVNAAGEGDRHQRQSRAHRGGDGQPRSLHHIQRRKCVRQCREYATERDDYQPGGQRHLRQHRHGDRPDLRQ